MRARLRKKEKEYAQVHRNMLFDQKISFKAKGVGAILESYSDDFQISQKTILSKSDLDKITSLKTATNELEHGYLCRIKVRGNGGHYEVIWIFDSQGLDEKYLKEIFNEYNVEEIYSKKYNSLSTPIKTTHGEPNTGCSAGGLSINGETVTYNNTIDKNRKNKNTLYQDEGFLRFTSLHELLTYFRKNYDGFEIYFSDTSLVFPSENGLNFLSTLKPIIKNGYLFNPISCCDFSSGDAKIIWKFIFKHRDKIVLNKIENIVTYRQIN